MKNHKQKKTKSPTYRWNHGRYKEKENYMREDKKGKTDQIQEDRRDETLGGEHLMEYAMLYYKVIQVKFV